MSSKRRYNKGYEYASVKMESDSGLLFNLRSNKTQRWWGKDDEYALAFVRTVQDLLLSAMDQSPGPELSKKWVEEKTRRKYSDPTRTWFGSGDLRANAFKGETGIEHEGGVKVIRLEFSDEEHESWYDESESLTYKQLVETLEFGLGGAPPRPIIGPVIDAIMHGDSPVYNEFSGNIRRNIEGLM